MEKPKIKRCPTFSIKFTKFELLHLRDVMSISLPPEGRQTISQALAALENRPMIESYLWRKISDACQQAELPVGSDAPDYVVAPIVTPAMGVFQLTHDPDQASQSEDDSDSMFGGSKEDDDDEEDEEEEDESEKDDDET